MSQLISVIRIVRLPEGRDVLTEILHQRARELLAKPIEDGVADFIVGHAHR